MAESFQFKKISPKQRKILNWWTDGSSVRDRYGIIADGAIRSGKTVSMSLSYVAWAMERFSGENFGLCGKTIGSLRRNVIAPLKKILPGRGYSVRERRGDNLLQVRRGDVTNEFYLFGGKDEGSQDLIQGITLAGCMLDEVALMPESFVTQATARCSVEGSKLWFNCNPEGPMHWFKKDWVDRAGDLNMAYLHLTMEDNLSLSEETKERYRRMYVGVFYQRYILGLWAMAEGLVYPMFTDANIYTESERPVALYSTARRTIACDYGTTNPCVFLDVWDDGQTLWIDREYRWDSQSDYARRSGQASKTDAQYGEDMVAFMGEDPERQCKIIVDPSAASFIAELRQRGYYVKPADNEVIDGIRKTASLVERRRVMVHESCTGLISEMQTYAWDEKASQRGEEKPLKTADHAPDALRYYINSLPEWRISA